MAVSLSFNIPDKDRSVLRVLAEMDELVFAALMDRVRVARPAMNPGGLAKNIRSAGLPSEWPGPLGSISRLLVNLGRPLYLDSLEIEDVVSSLAEYASSEGLITNDVLNKLLTARLTALFSSDVVKLAAKASGVLTSQPYAFRTARIITEIRPLFTEDEPLSPPSASVLVHQLRFDTFHNGDTSEIFIALDDSDLVLLRGVVEKAIRKSAILAEQESQAHRFVITEQE